MIRFLLFFVMILPMLEIQKTPRPDNIEVRRQIKQFDPMKRNLRLVPYRGGKVWVCDDPNCPEHCAEILKELKKNP